MGYERGEPDARKIKAIEKKYIALPNARKSYHTLPSDVLGSNRV